MTSLGISAFAFHKSSSCERIKCAGIAVVLRALSTFKIPMCPSKLGGKEFFVNRYVVADIAGLYLNETT